MRKSKGLGKSFFAKTTNGNNGLEGNMATVDAVMRLAGGNH